MDRAQKGLNDWLDEHEGKPSGTSNKNIEKERVRQGYKPEKKEKKAHTHKPNDKGFCKTCGKDMVRVNVAGKPHAFDILEKSLSKHDRDRR